MDVKDDEAVFKDASRIRDPHERARLRREIATAAMNGLLAGDVQNQRPLGNLLDAAVDAADRLLERLGR